MTAKQATRRLTRDGLNQALQPPNTCKVKTFLETLNDEDRELVEEALQYSGRDLSAVALRDWLISSGFPEDAVPGTEPICDHRRGKRPCRCRD